MLRFWGAALVFAGCAALGIAGAGRLSARVKALQAMLGALEQMERELSFRLTSMPDLLAALARTAAPPAGDLFRRCLEGLDALGEKSLDQIWGEALDTAGDLGEPALAALRDLGMVLGRYDAESQRQSVAYARDALEKCLRDAQGERARLGRVYTAVGVSAGALLAILLL